MEWLIGIAAVFGFIFLFRFIVPGRPSQEYMDGFREAIGPAAFDKTFNVKPKTTADDIREGLDKK